MQSIEHSSLSKALVGLYSAASVTYILQRLTRLVRFTQVRKRTMAPMFVSCSTADHSRWCAQLAHSQW